MFQLVQFTVEELGLDVDIDVQLRSQKIKNRVSEKNEGSPSHRISTMQARINRANLDPAKSYIKVQKVNDVTIQKPVGQFVRSYRMGSGDGMTLHWEFNLGGVITVENDQMWGSVSGSELTWFLEQPSVSTQFSLN